LSASQPSPATAADATGVRPLPPDNDPNFALLLGHLRERWMADRLTRAVNDSFLAEFESWLKAITPEEHQAHLR
jgi:hypothetical protein